MVEALIPSKYGKLLQEEFIHKFGVVLIKPDAVELGVDDYIIGRFTQELYEGGIGVLQGVYEVNVKKIDIPLIYPSMSKEDYLAVESYLTEGPSVLFTYTGSGRFNLQDRINNIKGKRLGDSSLEELDGKNGFGNSIRGMLPVPGTIKQFEPVVRRIKLKKNDPSIRFSDAEYHIYSKNLVHSPNDYLETFGLLCLLSAQQLREVLSSKQYLLFRSSAA